MTSSWKCLENVSEMSQSLCNHVTKRVVSERAGGGVCHPESKSKLCLFAFKSGSPEQTKIYLFAMGKSGGTSCFQSRYPKVNPERPSTLPIGSPKVNQDFVCLILGERRYMSPNDAKHQSLRPCYRTRIQNSL